MRENGEQYVFVLGGIMWFVIIASGNIIILQQKEWLFCAAKAIFKLGYLLKLGNKNPVLNTGMIDKIF
ncbi:hypothetical protein ACLSZW_05500 [Avibacterium avium]|uniref:hypothetical protein n=1 Tax=Avibacterium avium TaxID=751 RepID=UPI003BF7929C